MTEMLVIIAASLLLAWPLGLYLARVMRGTPMKVDVLFHWIEAAVQGVRRRSIALDVWRGYVLAFVLSNVVVAVLTQAVFMTQAAAAESDQIPNMRWDTALHTMISFLTNTNQQHYSGQAQLSYLSQMTGITGLQVVTLMMGLALAVATLRALFSRAPQAAAATGSGDDRQVAVGNYYVDVVRLCVRFLLPLCLVWTLLLTSGRAVDDGRWPAGHADRCQRRHGPAETAAGPGGSDGRGKAAWRQRWRLVRPEQQLPLENPTRCRTRWRSSASCWCRWR